MYSSLSPLRHVFFDRSTPTPRPSRNFYPVSCAQCRLGIALPQHSGLNSKAAAASSVHRLFRATADPNPTRSTQGFSQYLQFFANGKPPFLSEQPKLRALCYDAFAMLHRGQSKTPIFVAPHPNKTLEEDADEKCTNKFLSEASMPREERAELDDYKRSGYSRSHLKTRASSSRFRSRARHSNTETIPHPPCWRKPAGGSCRLVFTYRASAVPAHPSSASATALAAGPPATPDHPSSSDAGLPPGCRPPPACA